MEKAAPLHAHWLWHPAGLKVGEPRSEGRCGSWGNTISVDEHTPLRFLASVLQTLGSVFTCQYCTTSCLCDNMTSCFPHLFKAVLSCFLNPTCPIGSPRFVAGICYENDLQALSYYVLVSVAKYMFLSVL